ncbi:MAG: DUF2384 domain-containing protein [Sulfurimicrobium sp.]|jgi:putative toxin-antitoxin system antitoxin component (TIGR02293 family)|nr:DUF2384 domain-containing protein [Sulfurimicrobium sp.]MDZ7654481.1 antitoxin Xre/MbcA/ParS toxin-binding domain-containing protein [Sulfurimicrobium sp.]
MANDTITLLAEEGLVEKGQRKAKKGILVERHRQKTSSTVPQTLLRIKGLHNSAHEIARAKQRAFALKRSKQIKRREGIGAKLCVVAPETGSRARFERVLFSEILDIPQAYTGFDVAKLVESRVKVKIVDRMIDEGVTPQEIYGLVAPRRTLTHRRSKQEDLTVEESDRAVRLVRVLARAEAVFGDKEKAMRWLRRPMKRFDEKQPLEMLTTDMGSRLVEESLVQIDEGYFA